MTASSPDIALENLLAHSGWVRSLANQLVRDPDVAEDLAQETMLAALEARGDRVRSPRAWLGRVLRNLMFERLRGEQRRSRREAAVARAEPEPSSAELVERVDAHRSVVNAVMGLPEHYRLILLRRYYLDETPSAIAAALEMPVATVKTRLQRGLEQLRGVLDQRYGGPEQRRKALLPLVPITGAKVPVFGLMLTAAVMVLGGGAIWATGWFDAVEPVVVTSRGGAAPVRTSGTTTAPVAREEAVRDSAPTTVAGDVAAAWTALKMPARGLSGVALTADGSPAAGIVLQFVPDRERARGTRIAITDAGGAFELTVAGSGRVTAASENVVTLLAAMANTAAVRADLCVVVATPRALIGRVLDRAGNPLAEATVAVRPPMDLRSRFGARVSKARTQRFEATTDATGRFELQRIPVLPGAEIEVVRGGFAALRLPLPVDTTVEFRLERPQRPADAIAGQVVDPGGLPARDVRVACGDAVTRTDSAGRFWLPTSAVGERLIALRSGNQPGVLAKSGASWPRDIVLRLGPPPHTLRGRVVDDAGRPVNRAHVWIADPLLFSWQPGVCYQTASSTLGPIATQQGGAARRPEAVEALLGDCNVVWRPAVAGPDGRFELSGLCDREYLVMAGNPANLCLASPAKLRGDAGEVELRIARRVIDRVHGRVVDGAGRPLARVGVALQLDICELTVGGQPAYRQLYRAGSMVTGPDGEFFLYDVPRDHVRLHFRANGFVDRTVAFDVAAVAAPMTVGLTRSNELWVRSLDPVAVDAVVVLDRDGRRLRVEVPRGDESQQLRRVPLHAGRTEAFILPATAVTIVGFRAGDEVRRVPVPSRGGELQL
ncbi:MAG: sigma-70 family RNA polymerase sigma factor [bacterium]|nr:sigma-70 family RNA polymerase sigma factor [bacterium]